MKRILLLTLLLLASLVIPLEANKKRPVAICAIFRDQAPYLKEWIEYHRLIGVEQFYLYNHLSRDSYRSVLSPYIKKSIVELVDWKVETNNLVEWNKAQCDAYNHCLKKLRSKSQWIAFIDLDEFIVLKEASSIKNFMQGYDHVGGLCLNWQMFGTSHVKQIPPGKLLIETLISKATQNFPENAHVKSIVRSDRASHMMQPHSAIYFPPWYQVDTACRSFEGPRSVNIDVEKAQINHYWTRDEQFFFSQKSPQRSSWGESLETQLNRIEPLNQVQDESILKTVPALRKKLKL